MQNNQLKIEGQEQSWRTDTTQLQDLLQSYSHQASMVLTKINGTKINRERSTESPEIDSHKYNELIFDKEAKAIQWSRDNLFQQMVLDIHMQKYEFRHKNYTLSKN